MADKQSYNSRALMGDDYDDGQFQQDMKKMNINIPDDMLYTPEMNKYVLGEVKTMTMKGLLDKPNPDTGMNYTPEQAEMKAQESYDMQMEKFSTLAGKKMK